jgi:hypothetical protein
MTKQSTIELLGKQLPGFYSVEQVIKLINDIEDSETFEFHSDSIRELTSNIVDALDSEGIDLINDYDLSMNSREVELDSIEFDTSRIRRVVEDALEEFMEKIKEADAE